MEVRVACLDLKTAINTSAQYKFERFCQTIMFPSLIVWFSNSVTQKPFMDCSHILDYTRTNISLVVVKARSSFLKHFSKD